MNKYKDNCYIYTCGLNILSALTSFGKYDISIKNPGSIITSPFIDSLKQDILDNFGFKELAEVIRGYITDPALCHPACIIVFNILVDINDKKYVEGTNIEKLVLDIVKNYIGDPKICSAGALALSSLAFTSCKKTKTLYFHT